MGSNLVILCLQSGYNLVTLTGTDGVYTFSRLCGGPYRAGPRFGEEGRRLGGGAHDLWSDPLNGNRAGGAGPRGNGPHGAQKGRHGGCRGSVCHDREDLWGREVRSFLFI